jgi:hypothetical protein
MVAPVGLGILLTVVGLAILVVPGVGIVGVLAIVIGVLLIIGALASGRLAAGPRPTADSQ